jgi:Ni,Fe-hydrogenase I cytochrome b subunit
LCKLCWVEILSAGLWVGFSYWVRGSFKQGTIFWVPVVRLLELPDGRTYLEILIVKALVFFVVVEDFKSMILALHSRNGSSVIENWHFPRPCAAS